MDYEALGKKLLNRSKDCLNRAWEDREVEDVWRRKAERCRQVGERAKDWSRRRLVAFLRREGFPEMIGDGGELFDMCSRALSGKRMVADGRNRAIYRFEDGSFDAFTLAEALARKA